ncbi:15116_t:CDS:2 [Entrophospora sp. SA101]|nr:5755_t:CDS:2 [Entrophospora sp. SA101]CAJ0644922.1 15116_t:CDS:2 [Entrophospora sp. SA101]CAJ0839399.1 1491_t:CDS:2 [Entrophospora sp. SA101]CAJ0846984.1 5175_t:CDS:2 [Entrophospora sp. SA101]
MADSKDNELTFYNNLKGLDAYARHKKFMKDYVYFYGKVKPEPTSTSSSTNIFKTEFDILKENHKFIRDDEEEDEEKLSWEQRIAKKYYDKLFKEYCIVELKYYKEGKIALRWRIEKEVISGKGQFICASTKCLDTNDLKSWEVNFAYMEDGEKKNALVKIRLCPKCSDKLNYRKKHEEAKKKEKRKRSSTAAENSSSSKKTKHSKKHKKHKGATISNNEATISNNEATISNNETTISNNEATISNNGGEKNDDNNETRSEQTSSLESGKDDAIVKQESRKEDFEDFYTRIFAGLFE